jgi:hypothetical protein
MKKLFKVLLITVVVIFLLLVIIPFAFKGRILQIARDEINKNLNAKVEFADLRLSLIRNFPNLSVALIDLSVVGKDDFENDTLVSFNTFRVVVDVKSAIWGDAIEVRSILLDQPRLKAMVLDDGTVNWDIMIETEPETDLPEDPDAETADFHVQLKKFEIRNGQIEYDDVPLEVRTILDGFNLIMKGDLAQDITSLDISASSDIFDFWFDGIRYINNASLSLNTIIDADLNEFRFTFSDNEMKLNELTMGMEGFFAMPGSDIDMDISFYSTRTDFRTILSLVPAIYMTDFEDLTATGSLTLEGFVRGSVTDEVLPSVGLDLLVEDAGFRYPDLPAALENMHMNLNLLYDGVDEDQTTVDLQRFYMEMAGNPFEMRMSVRTPMSDMFVDAEMNGAIDFTSFADVIPLGDIVLRGLLESDISLSGNMSDIENEQFEDFNAGGSMRLTAFRYSDPDFPMEVLIPGAALEFSPRFVELGNFEMHLGRSDIRMNGHLENFIPYVFNDGTVRGSLLLSSTMLDLNELMEGEPAEETTDTVSMSVIEVPANVDFVLSSSIDSILFDNMEISMLSGQIIVRDQKILMEGVNMNMLEGDIRMNGEYNTQDMSNPFIDFAMEINNFDIPSSFHTFNTVQQLTPVAKDLRGSYSSTMTMYSPLDDQMMPVMDSLNAEGRLLTSNVEVVNSTTFDRLSRALNLREDKDIVLEDMDISFTITGGRVYLEPFDASMGPVDMVIGGDQGIDQTMNYVIRMSIPRSEFGAGANQVISDLAESAAERGISLQPGDKVNVDARVTGTFSDPQISLDMRETARSTMDDIRDQLRTRVTDEVEERVEQVEERVREEVSQRADQILEEAEERAAQIKSAAAEAAEKVRQEGEAAAAKVEEEASGRGRIAEMAAKRTADGIRSEADKKAEAIIREADERAEKLLQEAREEAEKLE